MNSPKTTQLISSPQASSEGVTLLVSATLEHIYVSSGHDYWGKRTQGSNVNGIQDLLEVECVEGRGLRGDRYFNGKPGRPGQVTFFQAEIVDAIRDRFQLPNLSAAVFRRNLVVRGMCLREMMGQRFMLQGITFEGAQECKPCVWMDRAVAVGAQSFMRDGFRGGLRARVCTTGLLCVSRCTTPGNSH